MVRNATFNNGTSHNNSTSSGILITGNSSVGKYREVRQKSPQQMIRRAKTQVMRNNNVPVPGFREDSMIQDLRGLSVKIVHNPADFCKDQQAFLTLDGGKTQNPQNSHRNKSFASVKRKRSSRRVKKQPEIEVIEVTDELKNQQIRNQQQQIQEVSDQLNSILNSLQQDRA